VKELVVLILRRQLPIILGIVIYSGVVAIKASIGHGLITFLCFSIALLPVTLFFDRKIIQLTFRGLKKQERIQRGSNGTHTPSQTHRSETHRDTHP
jgi:hypothetical protein